MTATIPFELDHDHRRTLVGGEPMIFHCHHYNTFLQQSICDADYIESRPFLIGAAAEVAFSQMKSLFEREEIEDIAQRKELAAELYRWAGFGTVDLSNLGENGGRVSTPSSHYAMAWRSKFGYADNPVCFFTSGWLAGANAAIHDLPLGSFAVEHKQCNACSKGDDCVFELTRGEPNYDIFQSVRGGTVSEKHQLRPEPETNVDREGIYTALTGMDISGDSSGIIGAFGVYLTRHYSNYYNRISFETLRAMELAFGDDGFFAARPLLVEAGHVCAFNTFGGIMTSPEWDAMIKPTCQNKEDWVHGMVAAVNSLGWGRWQVDSLNEKEARFLIHDDYESVGYRSMYGISKKPISFLAEGAAAGIMNLVYRGDVASRPTFDPFFYDKMFREPGAFFAEAGRSSIAMGDEITEVHVQLP